MHRPKRLHPRQVPIGNAGIAKVDLCQLVVDCLVEHVLPHRLQKDFDIIIEALLTEHLGKLFHRGVLAAVGELKVWIGNRHGVSLRALFVDVGEHKVAGLAMHALVELAAAQNVAGKGSEALLVVLFRMLCVASLVRHLDVIVDRHLAGLVGVNHLQRRVQDARNDRGSVSRHHLQDEERSLGCVTNVGGASNTTSSVGVGARALGSVGGLHAAKVSQDFHHTLVFILVFAILDQFEKSILV